mmetsp:Transcript_18094/g.20266  ORF Transcript_18094/g.20266 Transcript_18094/m.20266 type:complete len:122 (-) Transcript_18094:718-1083(-)
MFQRLITYKKKHNESTNVPRNGADPKLANWVNTQRKNYHTMNKNKNKTTVATTTTNVDDDEKKNKTTTTTAAAAAATDVDDDEKINETTTTAAAAITVIAIPARHRAGDCDGSSHLHNSTS